MIIISHCLHIMLSSNCIVSTLQCLSSHCMVCLQNALSSPTIPFPFTSCCRHLSSLQMVHITYATPSHCLVCLHVTLFVFTPSLSDHTVHTPHSRTRRGTNSSEQDASHPFPGVVLILGVTVRAADVGRGGGAGGGTQVLQQW